MFRSKSNKNGPLFDPLLPRPPLDHSRCAACRRVVLKSKYDLCTECNKKWQHLAKDKEGKRLCASCGIVRATYDICRDCRLAWENAVPSAAAAAAAAPTVAVIAPTLDGKVAVAPVVPDKTPVLPAVAKVAGPPPPLPTIMPPGQDIPPPNYPPPVLSAKDVGPPLTPPPPASPQTSQKVGRNNSLIVSTYSFQPPPQEPQMQNCRTTINEPVTQVPTQPPAQQTYFPGAKPPQQQVPAPQAPAVRSEYKSLEEIQKRSLYQAAGLSLKFNPREPCFQEGVSEVPTLNPKTAQNTTGGNSYADLAVQKSTGEVLGPQPLLSVKKLQRQPDF